MTMTNARSRKELKDYLYKRYKRFVLNKQEVEAETFESAKTVFSTSSVIDTWLIDDVVNFICPPSKDRDKINSKHHKEQTVIFINGELICYWKEANYDISELTSSLKMAS